MNPNATVNTEDETSLLCRLWTRTERLAMRLLSGLGRELTIFIIVRRMSRLSGGCSCIFELEAGNVRSIYPAYEEPIAAVGRQP